MIQLKNLSKTFHSKKKSLPALSEISLEVAKGDIFGIIGASGAGKSTLLRSINLLEKPSKGEVIIEGRNITNLSSKKLRQERSQMGMIFQHFNLLASRTVFGNIAFPMELLSFPKKEIRQRVFDLLEEMNLKEKALRYPSELSGGEKQRVAIARSLATRPKILLSDEATSALDPITMGSILELLKNINQRLGITILLITHQMEVIQSICNKVAVLDKGKIIEQGSVDTIFSTSRNPITRNLIRPSKDIALSLDYQNKFGKIKKEGLAPILKLEFDGEALQGETLSRASILFQISIKIISANISSILNKSFGSMYIQLEPEFVNLDKMIEFFVNKKVKVEVIGYV